jgi:hypothetical protein
MYFFQNRLHGSVMMFAVPVKSGGAVRQVLIGRKTAPSSRKSPETSASVPGAYHQPLN